MSLHNSTNLENQRLDFSLLVELRAKRLKIVLQNKFKAQRSGFEFERRSHEATKHLRLRKCEFCGANFDEGQANKSARGMPWH